MKRLAVLMTTFNRPAHTRKALASLSQQEGIDSHEVHVYIADASTDDETMNACAGLPKVTAFKVPATTFWAGGMRLAYLRAVRDESPDTFLWLNDDVVLFRTAVATLLRELTKNETPSVVGGALRDELGATSYTGYLRGPRWHRLALQRLDPRPSVTPCDALNGNVVAVSADADRLAGGFPAHFVHGMADLDFTLRANAAGVDVLLAPGYVGTCETNPPSSGWGAAGITYRERWKRILGPKGLPITSWFRYCIRNGGATGLLTFASPYLRATVGRGAGR